MADEGIARRFDTVARLDKSIQSGFNEISPALESGRDGASSSHAERATIRELKNNMALRQRQATASA